MDPRRRETGRGRCSLGRVGVPEDIGNAVVFLAPDRASFINATELTVDGGRTPISAGHN